MNKRHLGLWLRAWLQPGRLIPLITILVAGLAGGASLLGTLQLSTVEGIIIALLSLLAIDSLSERLTLLEGIQNRLSELPAREGLRGRSELPLWEDRAKGASQVSVLAVSAVSLLMNNVGLFEQLLEQGCTFRIALLDPESDALRTWNKMMKVSTTKTDIQTSLQLLSDVLVGKERAGTFEVRLSPVFLPYSVSIVDADRANASMVVEFYTYKTTFAERPHIRLAPSSDKRWFDFFCAQFEVVWAESRPWIP